MEPSIPTSFIPKRPVTSEPLRAKHNNHSVGLLSVVTVVIVIATIISFAGVYIYKQELTTQKKKMEQSIDDARNGIGTEFLSDMKRLNARIEGVKLLIQKHIVVTPIFTALAETTLHSVVYKSFTYGLTTDAASKAKMVQVTLTGTAKSYATIALQSDAFASNALIKNPVFSALSVNDKNTAVDFKLVFDVDPAALSYQTFIDKNTSTSARTQGTASTTTKTTLNPDGSSTPQ